MDTQYKYFFALFLFNNVKIGSINFRCRYIIYLTTYVHRGKVRL